MWVYFPVLSTRRPPAKPEFVQILLSCTGSVVTKLRHKNTTNNTTSAGSVVTKSRHKNTINNYKYEYQVHRFYCFYFVVFIVL